MVQLRKLASLGFNPLDRGNLYQISVEGVLLQDQRTCFNPLDRGNLYQIYIRKDQTFCIEAICFNPLDRGNLYQMKNIGLIGMSQWSGCFNPLDRGNLYQIVKVSNEFLDNLRFQSPRSGKFVSDLEKKRLKNSI